MNTVAATPMPHTLGTFRRRQANHRHRPLEPGVQPGDRPGRAARCAGQCRRNPRRDPGSEGRASGLGRDTAIATRPGAVQVQGAARCARSMSLRASSPASTARCCPDARGEVTRGIEVVEFACGIPHLLKGEFSDSVGSGIDSWSLRQPVGVCAGITPFNFPAMVPMWMFPHRHCLRQHLHPQAVGERSLLRAATRGVAERSGTAARRVQRGQRRS